MPWSLKHFQESGQLHYLTFSCYHRQPKLGTPAPRDLFVKRLETVRQQYGLFVYGFVVMPEHVHLLLSEPEKGRLAQALQSLKQSIARKLALRVAEPFWQHDFNVRRKFTDKLRYIHRNPVTRGLAARPEDWPWSSFRHYMTGEQCGVQIESQWTVRRGSASEFSRSCRAQRKPPPKRSLSGASLRVGATLSAGHPPVSDSAAPVRDCADRVRVPLLGANLGEAVPRESI